MRFNASFKILFAILAVTISGSGSLRAAEDGIVAEIVKSRTLKEGRRTPVIVKLAHDSGFPVMGEELQGNDTVPMHLLAVDPSLNDFHHYTPQAMNVPGQYIFAMTPRTACTYKAWVHIVPASGRQEYVAIDIPGAEDCKDAPINAMPQLEYKDSNHKYTLSLDSGLLMKGQEATAKLTVRSLGGRYIDELQPVMGAYGYMVGFYDDRATVAAAEAVDQDPSSYHDRGGPTLSFHFTPGQSGFLRLFVQLRINDKDVYVPFGVTVGGGAVMSDYSDGKAPWEMDADVEDQDTLDIDPFEDEEDALAQSILEDALKRHDKSEQQDALKDLFKEPEPQDNSVYENTEKKILQNDANIPPQQKQIFDGGKLLVPKPY
ncbi:MAG: hypothetical protein H6867_07130 [Rhodospirillales bacterium]|nr:hypothetical protein [Rhodospirillales bacterium]MCB9995323.1 hypothetical protein [Rhodospirillales bacterium]